MTWLVWRQHRHQALSGAAALAAFTVLLLITGLQMASQYHSALASCAASNSCGTLAATLTLGSSAVSFLVTLTLAVPALLGLFWGAPLVARELETGTSTFAWMQSITRTRWLTVKTGWVLAAAAAWGGAVTALITWWSGPDNALHLDAFQPGQFDIQGIVPIGYALFAVALGITAGALLRRSLPALAATLGIFTVVRIVITDYIRPHYMTPVTTLYSLGQPGARPSGAVWNLAYSTLAPSGHLYPSSLPGLLTQGMSDFPLACRALAGQGKQIVSCLAAHGFREELIYQPASRYWAFQGIETGIFAVLAAALLAVTAIVVLRRDA